MCEYTQREFNCGHIRWIVSRWCWEYQRTGKRCQPNVTHFEYRGEERCGECRPRKDIPWENMIKRSKQTSQA